jgi:dTDP-4-amino-4,6-dideoxygalactose transaminase
MSGKLAILGGEKTRNKPWPPFPVLGEEEKKAVLEVLDEGRLSYFIASVGKDFLGGKKIQELEQLFSKYHNVKYAVSFNSATAALHAAIVACTVKPGEEVITTPYTFTSTATSAFMHNAVPVFVDIKPDTCNIDPVKIKKQISPLSRAIIPVHLFGNPADMDEIMEIAEDNDLKVIEDCAQAPGAKYKNKYVGTIGDCGIFSLTENKNITSGEGGILITNDEEIADISRLIRNHGETVVAGQKKRTYKSTILGWNYRMTEIDAAVGVEQFKKMDSFNNVRIKLSEYLSKNLQDIDWLEPPTVYDGNKHVYYVYHMFYNKEKTGIDRSSFLEALNAEGIPFAGGYVKPLYYNPIFHENKPFIFKHYKGNATYEPGMCPVAEKCHFEKLILTPVPRPTANEADMEDVVSAIIKIDENLDSLKNKNPSNVLVKS